MDHREMTRLAGDPPRVRALATMIARLGADTLDARMHDFLARLSRYDGDKPLSLRQLETLDALREATSRSTMAGRYPCAVLAARAWEVRLDLNDEEAEAWLDGLHRAGPGLALSTAERKRLVALCRRLAVIAGSEWVELD